MGARPLPERLPNGGERPRTALIMGVAGFAALNTRQERPTVVAEWYGRGRRLLEQAPRML